MTGVSSVGLLSLVIYYCFLSKCLQIEIRWQRRRKDLSSQLRFRYKEDDILHRCDKKGHRYMIREETLTLFRSEFLDTIHIYVVLRSDCSWVSWGVCSNVLRTNPSRQNWQFKWDVDSVQRTWLFVALRVVWIPPSFDLDVLDRHRKWNCPL